MIQAAGLELYISCSLSLPLARRGVRARSRYSTPGLLVGEMRSSRERVASPRRTESGGHNATALSPPPPSSGAAARRASCTSGLRGGGGEPSLPCLSLGVTQTVSTATKPSRLPSKPGRAAALFLPSGSHRQREDITTACFCRASQASRRSRRGAGRGAPESFLLCSHFGVRQLTLA